MTDAPEKIWAKPNYDEWLIGGWDTHGKAGGTPYRRADLPATREQIMASPEVRALVEAAEWLMRAPINTMDEWNAERSVIAALAAFKAMEAGE